MTCLKPRARLCSDVSASHRRNFPAETARGHKHSTLSDESSDRRLNILNEGKKTATTLSLLKMFQEVVSKVS